MSATIFNQSDYSDILKRIDLLSASSQRKWGTMIVEEMLEHCSIQLKIALGMEKSHPHGFPLYRTKMGQWIALYLAPWPKGTATPKKMNVKKNKPFIGDIQALKKNILELLEQVQKAAVLFPHPFFGNLSKKDWGRLIWKHLDHHLRQFSA